MHSYNPSTIESAWQKRWDEAKIYEVDLAKAKNPYYSLVMFPYPSGAKLHVGHWYQYGPTDSYARFLRMQGKDVFFPMGFDAFGLPAENYAVKTGVHPAVSTVENVTTMIRQFKRMGCSYDWSKLLNTSEPAYYRWTQWLFLEMQKNGLAYKKKGLVNFCPSCQTVLANEQVWEGKCERCESVVLQKPLTQWYWKTTSYTERLLQGLDGLDWPEKTKTMQRNWIGRSDGAEIMFEVAGTHRGVIEWNGTRAGLKPDEEFKGDVDPALKGGDNDTSVSTDNDMCKSIDRISDQFVNRGLQAAVGAPPLPSIGLQPSQRTLHLVIEPKVAAFLKKETASFFLRTIGHIAKRHDITIHEACAMSDHVHLLISFREGRHLEKDIVQKLKGGSAHDFNQQYDAHGALWRSGHHFEEVNTSAQFTSVLHYIQQNPIKANLDPKGRILSRLLLTLNTFTTTADTIYGVTFLVISPEHPLLPHLLSSAQRKKAMAYIEAARNKTDMERMMPDKEKTGVFTGTYVIHPYTEKPVPLWIADYVLMSYGTGVVMGVPAHDQRDMDFAQKYELPIVQSIQAKDGTSFVYDDVDKYHVQGTIVDSGMFTGMPILEGRNKIVEDLQWHGAAAPVIHYRLRDWCISRQRYWGALIPIVYDPEGKPHPIPEKHLPWLLPTDVEFKPTGTSPIAGSKELKERTEKIFGKGWMPEVDTMDTFVCSSFYQFRFLAEGNQKEFVPKKTEKMWMPVQTYIGGPEHACMHLIYARFVTMVLHDLGHVSVDEPFRKLIHQGLITNQGAKMSKSKGNVVSPDAFVERYGSDVFRMYLMFMGPYTDGGDWSDTGIKGIDRFVKRVYTFFTDPAKTAAAKDSATITPLLHATIKKVGEDISTLHFNTAISTLMTFLNEAERAESISKNTAKIFATLLAPLAPHLAEELWHRLGEECFVVMQKWPMFDEKFLTSDTFTLVIQINGKVRANIQVPSGITKEEAIARAKEQEKVRKYLEGNAIKKEIFIPDKLINIVV